MSGSIVQVRARGKGQERGDRRGAAAEGVVQGLDSRVELIQALIPLGLRPIMVSPISWAKASSSVAM